MDYGSDLDLVLIYDEANPLPIEKTNAEFYSRFVEILVTTLSAFTREGHLYRVDLRLRPDGKNGAASIGKNAFADYLTSRSAIWEWLAYVKLRGVSGDMKLALEVEKNARSIIHKKASAADKDELSRETRRIRSRIETEKTRGSKDVNIKFGAGGLLDVYFAMRFLQLRDNVPDNDENRSTQFMLNRLFENHSLSAEDFSSLSQGHLFLSEIDHNLRLTVGRSNRLPLANKLTLQTISERMNLDSTDDLFEKLSLHRIEIRSAFDNILK
jgi:glutamate-ammonia-ligase adenylyltransferase